MTSTYPEYSADAEIEAFFKKTSATRAACDARARELVGNDVAPVDIQGVCSYSVYAGPELEYVVQFRLESLALKNQVISQVNEVYGSLAPKVSFEGKVGERGGNGEPLYVYLMTRVRGVTHLDFVLAHNIPKNAPENVAWRKTIIGDIAQYVGTISTSQGQMLMLFAASWLCLGKPLSESVQSTVAV
jgi:hypothetical protein